MNRGGIPDTATYHYTLPAMGHTGDMQYEVYSQIFEPRFKGIYYVYLKHYSYQPLNIQSFVLTQFVLVSIALVCLVVAEVHSVFVLGSQREASYLMRGFWS